MVICAMDIFVFLRARFKAFTLSVCLLLSVFIIEMIIILTEPDYVQQIKYRRGTTFMIRDEYNHVQFGGTRTSHILENTREEKEHNSMIWIPRTSEENMHSDTYVQEVLRNASRTHGNGTVSAFPTIRVGFFERGRKYWTYTNIFKSPESPRTCECGTFKADVVMEKNPKETGKFDILFFPQDVGYRHLGNRVWKSILSSASRSQKRIYATFEGASKLKSLVLGPPFRNKIFHWSWTYHSQSDFYMPYGVYLLKPKNTLMPLDENKTGRNWSEGKSGRNWSEGKTSLLAWMSSWSVTSWKRKDFAKELRKHIPIDFYGQNFKHCPRNSQICEGRIRKYKFYLALENSCCSEYITEKFWRTLAWDIVPIVIGAPRKDYERLAPPNSFIHADDYDSIEDLAKYIMYLDKNDDQYSQYFRWKEEGEVIVKYPPIEHRPVKHNIPPANFFYSCNAVCKVGKRYLDEKTESKIAGSQFQSLSTNSYFDTGANWWCGSCVKCGHHKWINKYNIEEDLIDESSST